MMERYRCPKCKRRPIYTTSPMGYCDRHLKAEAMQKVLAKKSEKSVDSTGESAIC